MNDEIVFEVQISSWPRPIKYMARDKSLYSWDSISSRWYHVAPLDTLRKVGVPYDPGWKAVFAKLDELMTPKHPVDIY
jgi:hypothetical protein